MSIHIQEERGIFRIDTARTSYVCGVGVSGYLNHYYYGPRLGTDGCDDWRDLERVFDGISFSPFRSGGVPLEDTRNLARQECTTSGIGDYRTPSVTVRDSGGCACTDPVFVSARAFPGRPEIKDMPHARVNGDESAETLEITLRDPVTEVEFVLDYTVFPVQDVIVRSMLVRNASGRAVTLERAMSFCLDLPHAGFDLLQCPGTYGRERYGIVRNPVHPGVQGLFSTRTSSGHDANPAFALAERNADEFSGGVYGFVLVYSGSFAAEVEQDPFARVRVLAGIHPETFEWRLEPGGSFRTPEAFLTFSASGIGGMSRNFHDMMRDHLIPPEWAHAERPVLVNNWEGTGMNFTREKLLAIASDAAALGMDMFVLDDGWFGHRDDDRSSLGDWFEYESKVGSIRTLGEAVNRLGLKFGLWFEPEMISEDSELYRAHPEWVFTAPGRVPTLGRNQMVLNFGIPEVVEHIFRMIEKILADAPVFYMKWDMNRQPAEISNPLLPADRQKESGHRYVLGVYELHRRIRERFPRLLIEGCSGGGGRFDAGILYYAPQIWTSDNTNAMHRLWIQSGTSLFYPCSAQGAHVAANSSAPVETRAAVAMAGTFGYELDLTRMDPEEKKKVGAQIGFFRRVRHLVSDGDHYRLVNPWENEAHRTVWEFAAKDASEALVIAVQSVAFPSHGIRFLKLHGLDPERRYRLEGSDRIHTGAFLINAGLPLDICQWRAGSSLIWHFTAV